MDSLINIDVLLEWISNYGSIAIFALLVFGIIALPIPEETLLVFSGILIKQGTLELYPTLIAAYAGSICGISVSYLLGKTAGNYLITKYKSIPWLNKHYERALTWFDRFGRWALLIGYFIPGVRHFTGFASGSLNMPFKEFALFAYTGAIFWVSCFVFIGFFFGKYGVDFLETLDLDLSLIIALFLVAGAIYLIIYKRLSSRKPD